MQADPEELAKFEAMAAEWWDPNGPVAPLHRMNPLRLAWIRDHFVTLRDAEAPPLRPLKGLRILDVGCGAGLAAEPMARMGAQVTGIDLAAANIEAARQHAEDHDVTVDYRNVSLESIVDGHERFDAVTLLEIIEHVPDQQAFLSLAAECIRPGGLLVVSTISRTLEAYAKAILAAEYLLGWLAPGTHDWRKFVKPSEMARMLRHANMTVTDITGVAYDAAHDRFERRKDPSVNYMMIARKG